MREQPGGTFGAALRTLGFLLLASVALAADRGADGEFEERHSSHFVLFQDVDIDQSSGFHGSRRFEQRVLEVLESAYVQIDSRLGLRPDGPITVVVYDPAIFRARFGGLFRFPAAGFYGGRVHVRGGAEVTSALSSVLHHELVHAAMASEISLSGLPGWFSEGVAEWFEARTAGKRRLSVQERLLLQQAARNGALFSLSELSMASFARLEPASARLAYLESYGFVAHLAHQHSESRIREWVREVSRTGDLERASRRAFRLDLGRLEARYIEELTQGGP